MKVSTKVLTALVLVACTDCLPTYAQIRENCYAQFPNDPIRRQECTEDAQADVETRRRAIIRASEGLQESGKSLQETGKSLGK